jgi:hypothetical protein
MGQTRHGQTRHAATRRRKTRPAEEENLSMWVGWVAFAGIVMGTAGLLNILQGTVALFNDGYYTTAGSQVVAIDYTTWGVALLATGLLLIFTGYGVVMGRTWARVVGVILATFDAIINFAFIGAYPIWGVLAVSLDLIAIFAIAVHGREARVLR